MNRCETFPALSISSLVLRVKRAGLLIVVEEDAQDIQVQVVGTAKDAGTFQFLLSAGHLSVVQPRQAKAGANLQVVVSLPPDWKGALEASTVSGKIIVRGVTGTDLSLRSLRGSIHAEGLTGITITLRPLLGAVDAHDLACDDCVLRTFTGSVTLAECGFLTCKARTFTGAVSLGLVSPFDMLVGRSFTGITSITAPVNRADVSLRSLSGRLLTEGVSISPGAPGVHVRSFTGNLQLNCSPNDTAATI